jgi:hypothetical protein
MALDLKKKLGPLPVWAWAGVGIGAIGIVYYLHEQSSSSSTTASTTAANDQAAQLAAEQAASGGTGDYGGGGDGGVASPTTPPAPADTSTVSDIDTQLQGINSELAGLSAQGVTDQTAGQSSVPFSQEISDVTGAISSLKSAGLISTSAPNSSSSAAKAKSVAGNSIITQLEDLKQGLVTKKQLGTGATAALAKANGNVTKAITERETDLAKAAKKPTTHATKPKK